MGKRKILISAYGCEPFKGTEQGVGWNWVVKMAKYNELYIITRKNNKEIIESNIPKDVEKNLNFIYHDANQLIRKLKRKERGLYFYYFIWQLGVYKIAKKMLKDIEFDYSMHLSFGSMWMPTFLPFIKIPFIWGPVGGGESVPFNYLKMFPFKQKIVQFSRILLKKTSCINPLILVPSKRACAILTRTEESAKVIPRRFREKNKVILETAMENEIINYLDDKLDDKKNNGYINLIYTGRLIPIKAVENIIHALPIVLKEYKVKLTIIGKGPEKKNINKLIEKYNIYKNVEVLEEIPRQEVLKKLAESDIYLFPSLKEGGTWALMEAMALKLPCICMNLSGMSVITDDTTAIRLNASNPKQTIIDFAEAIISLIENKEYANSIAENGHKRILNEFNWEKKGEFIERLLSELDKKYRR